MKPATSNQQLTTRSGQAPRRSSGQVIILAVLTLGGILLSTAAVAGVLLVYQIRNTNDAVNSAKAIFAADAGIEAASFCYFSATGGGCDPEAIAEGISFSDADVSIDLEIDESPDLVTITSKGFAARGKVIRTLEAFFSP